MKLTTFLAATAALVTTLSTHAATIAWGAAQNITGDADVDTTGSLIRAFNFGPAPVASLTVNGVIFEGKSTASGTVGDFVFGLTRVAFGDTHPNGLSSAYGSMVADSVAVFNNEPATITMNNLDLGETYHFQWWSNLGAQGSDYTAQANGGPLLDANASNLRGGTGQFQIGTFIADNSSHTVTFTVGPGQSFGIVSGFQLRAGGTVVPEPGTALFALGLLGVTVIRRQRR